MNFLRNSQFNSRRKIVLIGSQGQGTRYFGRGTRNLLRRLSGKAISSRAGSFALICYTGRGRRPNWVRQVQRGRGASTLKRWIRLPKYNRRKHLKYSLETLCSSLELFPNPPILPHNIESVVEEYTIKGF